MPTLAFQGILGPGRFNADFTEIQYDGQGATWDVNGDTPLDTFLTMIRPGPRMTSVQCRWSGMYVSAGSGAVAGLYTDVACQNTYTGGTATAGTPLYAKVAQALALEFREGLSATLRYAGDEDTPGNPGADVQVRVNGNPILAGASSVIPVILQQDDGQDSNNDLTDCDWIIRGADQSPVAAESPRSIGYEEGDYVNYAQKIITSVEISAEELRTRYLDRPNYLEWRMSELLRQHKEQLNRAMLTGVYYHGYDRDMREYWTMNGIEALLRQYAVDDSDNTLRSWDYRYDSTVTGLPWLDGGYDWLCNRIDLGAGLYGRTKTKVALCTKWSKAAVTRLAEDKANITIVPGNEKWGFQIDELQLGGTTLLLKENPDWNREFSDRDRFMVVDMEYLTKRPWEDTYFKGCSSLDEAMATKDLGSWRDSVRAQYYTHLSLELKNPLAHVSLRGLGWDNTQQPG